MPRIAPLTVARLSKAQAFHLARYLEAEYTTACLTDTDFAAKASAALNFPVNTNHIASTRAIFNIPAWRDVKRAAAKVSPSDFDALQKRLEVLERRVDVYIAGGK